MRAKDRHPSGRRSDRRGIAMVTVLVALVALIAAAALAIDIGLVMVARTQLQNATDAAALAGAANLIDETGPTVTFGAARLAAQQQAALNKSVAEEVPDGVAIAPEDIRGGFWDLATRTFNSSVSLADPEKVNAVDVTARQDGIANSPVPAIMARILGRDHFAVSAHATAYLGFAGSKIGKGRLDMPIAIDCCKLRGADCEQDYCETIATPPNPCPLTETVMKGHQDPATVSCIEFNPTADQNACWTIYDPDGSSVGASEVRDMVDTGYQQEVESLFAIGVANGTNTSAISEIQERMQGKGMFKDNPAGSDRYPPYDGYADSWVVGLPVIECQSEAHCGTSEAQMMVGFVCFEIREVIASTDHIIKGRFLCPTDPLFEECPIGPTGSGGGDFGIRSDLPVLVR
jgi:Flp pilus assembly protein TadG